MKLKDIKKGLPYVVCENSYCGTLRKGDHIKIDEHNFLLCKEAMGWLDEEEMNDLGDVEVELDEEARELKKARLLEELSLLDRSI